MLLKRKKEGKESLFHGKKIFEKKIKKNHKSLILNDSFLKKKLDIWFENPYIICKVDKKGFVMTVTPELKSFMEAVWTASSISGNTVVDRRVKFGSQPDIQFTVELPSGEIDFVSAFDMFENNVEFV